MNKNIVIAVVLGVLIIFGSYIILNNNSMSVKQVDLHSLSNKEAVEKLAIVESQIAYYEASSKIIFDMKIPILVLMSIKSETNIEESVDRLKKEYSSESSLVVNSSYEAIKGFDFSGMEIDDKQSSYNVTKTIIKVKDGNIITNVDGKITQSKLNDEIWSDQDRLIKTFEILNESNRFVYLPDEKINGKNNYVLKFNMSVNDAFKFVNDSEDSKDYYKDIKLEPDFKVWIDKETLVVSKIHMTIDMMQNNTGIFIDMDYKLKNVRFT